MNRMLQVMVAESTNPFSKKFPPVAAMAAAMILSSCASIPDDAEKIDVDTNMDTPKFSHITGTLRPVPHVEIEKLMGDWFVHSVIPYWAERGAHGSIERYRLRPDGKIATEFLYRKKAADGPIGRVRSIAVVTDHPSNAVWQVVFFRFVRIPYVIIGLDPSYEWVLIGHPKRQLGWILSRSNDLSEDQLAVIAEVLRAQGYDPGQFERVPSGKPFPENELAKFAN